MFARWPNARLKAADNALRQGRVDDAYAAAADPELRQHPAAKRLAAALVKPLVARARVHRQAGRYRDAVADLERIEALGLADPDAQALMQQIRDELHQDVRLAAQQRAAVGRAEQDLQAGRLDTGKLHVERIDDPHRRAALAAELDVRIERSSQLLQQAAEALDNRDVLAALRHWRDACQRHGRSAASDAFAGRLAGALARDVPAWIAAGQLDRVTAAEEGLGTLLGLQPAVGEAVRMAELCARAVQQFAHTDYAGLRQTLLRLKGACGEAEWLKGALSALEAIGTQHERLLASPLGLYSTAARAAASVAPPSEGAAAPPALACAAPADPRAARLDRPLLMLVDGGGSSLLLAGDLVRIGRSGAQGVDVAIPGDLHSHHADIVRRGEDYFLTAYGPAEVNRRRVQHVLLRDADRVSLGQYVKFVFSRPSSMSQSAVLRLSHRNRLADDVGDVVLFHDTCLVGPQSNCHVRVRGGNEQLVLFERSGGLHARQTAGAAWMIRPAQPAAPGETLEFGDLRVTIRPFRGAGRETGR